VSESARRTIDHVVHAVSDLEAAASSYASLGFTVTPRADHPFGTSNRLVVLDESYVEIVAVTRPEQLPENGFAARVARRLRTHGDGISHLVLSSADPPADLAALGPAATGEIFSFSRPAPQPNGTSIKASFECTLMHGTDELGMFLCKHLAPEAVWNEATTWHSNLARRITAVSIPVSDATLREIASAAGCEVDGGRLTLGPTTLLGETPAHIGFDARIQPIDICGVRVGGSPD
jgi:hypothetical protein